MTKKTNRLISCILSVGLLLFVITFIIVPQINIDLSKSLSITGVIQSAGIMKNSSVTGGRYRIKINSKVFFIILGNSNKIFETYRPNQNYSKLLNNIKYGDTVTIHFSSDNSIYQIKKDGQIIQDYESYTKNYKTLGWLCGIGLIIMTGIGFYPYYKDGKRRKNRGM